MSIVVVGRAARTGWQAYVTGPEYRDPSEVFAKDSMASWVGAPVIVGHVTVDVNEVDFYAVGYVRSVERDGEHVRAEMVIYGRDAIDAIERGELVELSAGYSTDRDVSNWQRNIRINHVALIPKGAARCGRSCSLL